MYDKKKQIHEQSLTIKISSKYVNLIIAMEISVLKIYTFIIYIKFYIIYIILYNNYILNFSRFYLYKSFKMHVRE